MAEHPERRERCCLCGKTKDQVSKLIVGLHGAVCSDCIDLVNDILRNAPVTGVKPPRVFDRTENEKGYTLDVVPAIAKIFPDPLELNEILMMLARSVDSRAK